MLRFVAVVLLLSSTAWAATYPDPVEGDYLVHDFKFATGEMLPELRLHYTTIGSPSGDAVPRGCRGVRPGERLTVHEREHNHSIACKKTFSTVFPQVCGKP